MKHDNHPIINAMGALGLQQNAPFLVEEMAELTVAFSHYKRERCTGAKVLEELADVLMMVLILRACVNEETFDAILLRKLNRMWGRYERGELDHQ